MKTICEIVVLLLLWLWMETSILSFNVMNTADSHLDYKKLNKYLGNSN